MKAKEIVKEKDIPEKECDVCFLHAKAYKKIPDNKIICPHCNEELDYKIFDSPDTIVGGTNSYNPNEDIYKLSVICCPECGEYIALLPIKVIHNANHDIYYTGADYYLTEPIQFDNDKIERLINDYTTRILNGEKNLTAWNLRAWLNDEFQHAVAKYLHDRGLKFIINKL